MAEPIELSFGMESKVLDGCVLCTPTPPGKYGWTIVRGGYEQSAKGGNAAYSQIPPTYDRNFVQVHDVECRPKLTELTPIKHTTYIQ